MNDEISKLITPPNKETLWANIATQLKSLIFSQKLKFGDKMPSERELAKMFGVSRVVVKQALLALEHTGFITTKLGSKGGAFITYDPSKSIQIFLEDSQKIDGLNISHFNQLREALEFESIKLTIQKANDEIIEKLNTINEEFAKPENRHHHSALNVEFHLAIAEFSGNPLIKNLLKPLLELTVNFPGTTISKNFIRKVSDDHKKIIQAIKDKNVEVAFAMMTQNISRVK